MKQNILCLILFVIGISLYAATVWETPTCLRQGVDIEWSGGSAETNDNNVIYVWSDFHTGVRVIYAQEFSKLGIPIWTEPQPITESPGIQETPYIVKVGSNQFDICWVDYSTNDKGNIYVQSINQYGEILWMSGAKLICSTQFIKRNIQIASGNTRDCYIVWEDYRNGNCDIYGQRLDYDGQLQWTTEGKQLTYMPFDETNVILVNDTYDGFMLGYNYAHFSNNYAFLCHFGNNGNMSWDLTHQISPELHNVKLTSLIPFNNNSFVYTFRYIENTYKVGVQRIDRAGYEYWDNPTVPNIVVSETEVSNPTCSKTLDDKIVVAWVNINNMTGEKSISVKKILETGVLDEYPTIDIPVSYPQDLDLSYKCLSDLNGGFYTIWKEEDNSGSGNVTIKALHYGADGSNMYQNPVIVTHSSKTNTPMSIFTRNSSLSISWQDQHEGNMGIFTQLYNVTGTPQCEINGKSIVNGINSVVEQSSIRVIHRTNDTVVFWDDLRNESDWQIYYQIINEDGTPQLEANGRLLASLTYGSQFAVCLGENNEIAIAWQVSDNQTYSIMGQLIDVNGNKLWGDNGINLTGICYVSQIYPQLSYENGAFYLAWMKFTEKEDPNCIICGQKIVDGQVQWGDEGVFVSDPTININIYPGPTITGRYYIWSEDIGSAFQIKAQHLSVTGVPVEGWPDYGRRVDDFTGDYQRELEPQANSNDEGVYISWYDQRVEDITNLYAQKISPDGQLMWDHNGSLMTSQQISLHKQILSDNDIFYLWEADNHPVYFIGSSLYQQDNTPIWQNHTLLSFEDNAAAYYIDACLFANDGYLVTALENWIPDAKLKYIYLSQDGTPIGSTSGNYISNQDRCASYPALVSSQNYAYLAWSEYSTRYYDSSYEIYREDMAGLYLQKLNNETVGNNDPVTPILSFALEQNYPNPFNPETTIKYSLPSQSIVKLDIYNIKGQKVKTLVNEKQAAGNFSIKWDGKDDADNQVASGVYFYRLDKNGKSITKKMVMLK